MDIKCYENYLNKIKIKCISIKLIKYVMLILDVNANRKKASDLGSKILTFTV